MPSDPALRIWATTSRMNHAGRVAAGGVLRSLDGEWLFTKDGRTRAANVPHDWAIEGPFDAEGACDTGKLPYRGHGSYTRTFKLSADERALLAAGGEVYIEFDGAMANPSVVVNSQEAGGWDYGYMSFTLPIGRFITAGDNELKITCDTRKHDSRWYPGAGLYRSVRLKTVPRDHMVPGSLFITTPEIASHAATVQVEYELSESGPQQRSFTVENPVLWDVDHPRLYTLEIEGETFRYGIRGFTFTADDGFLLNGRRLQLKGVCLHSDLGPLGMAFSNAAARRQLAMMKDMGVNAIRTAHNPPAPEFLDLCDEMGFVVWDEAFDKWDGTAGRAADQPLEQYISRNLRQFIRRDRNHPSVVVWSIGNEIPAASEAYPDGVTRERCTLFRQVCLECDTTRPVGIGAWQASTASCFEDLDVTGWNYARRYLAIRRMYPNKPIIYTESWDRNPYYAILPKYRLIWNELVFEPGELVAVCYRNRREIARASLKTAGAPAKVKLECDPYSTLDADVVFVRVSLTDAAGIRIPDAHTRVDFLLEGAGEIVSVGNADPAGLASFKDVASHPLFFGYAVAVVRRKGPGDIRLKAAARGLQPARFVF